MSLLIVNVISAYLIVAHIAACVVSLLLILVLLLLDVCVCVCVCAGKSSLTGWDDGSAAVQSLPLYRGTSSVTVSGLCYS